MLSQVKKFSFAIGLICLFASGCSDTKKSPEKLLETWWKSYKNNFLLSDGRIQRPEHAYDTVSEGQAYAMIFAVFMNDRETFDLIFRWTEEHLSRDGRHGDHLLAWHWKDGEVNDWMAASDADGDYAFALLLASSRWRETIYREKAVQVINDILKLETARGTDNRLFLLPGLWGNEKDGSLVQNPSYYSPAAFRLFYEATQDNQWLNLIDTAYWLVSQAGIRLDTRQGCGLIPDWCMVDAQENIVMAEGRSSNYGWDAIRIPMRIGLDMLWYKTEESGKIIRRIHQFLQASIDQTGEIKAVYQYTGEPAEGYGSLAADAMALFAAQALNLKENKVKISLKNKLDKKSLMQNYYGQSLAFFPLAFEEGILKRP